MKKILCVLLSLTFALSLAATQVAAYTTLDDDVAEGTSVAACTNV